MADQELAAKLSSEGRIVVPARVRKTLGISAGDMVWFEVDPRSHRVELVTAHSLIERVWAANSGVTSGDASIDVRAMRDRDVQLGQEEQKRIAQDAAEPFDVAFEMARVLAALNLAP